MLRKGKNIIGIKQFVFKLKFKIFFTLQNIYYLQLKH